MGTAFQPILRADVNRAGEVDDKRKSLSSNISPAVMELPGGAFGVMNGATLGMMDSFRRMGIGDDTPEDRRILRFFDRVREDAPTGFQVGSQLGSLIPTAATGGLAKAPMEAIRNPFVRDAVYGAVTEAVPVLLSESFHGAPVDQVLLDTASAALSGGAFGALTRAMLEYPNAYGKTANAAAGDGVGWIDNEVYNGVNQKSYGPDGSYIDEGAGETFTQGLKIPDELLNTKPSHSPAVSKWLNGGGKIELNNGTWKYTNKLGVSVIYKNGYPDFKGSGHVVQEANIGGFIDYYRDYKYADMITGGRMDPINNIWHHLEDGSTVQEVNKQIHMQFTKKTLTALY